MEPVLSRWHIRPAALDDAAAIAVVHAQSWRETYPGIVPDAYLASLDAARLLPDRCEVLKRGETLCFVAVVEGRVVGFADGGASRDAAPVHDGELHALYLLAACHGAGIGRALLLTMAEALRRQGYRAMHAWAIRENLPARQFYAAMGATAGAEQAFELGGTLLHEIHYGWPALARLPAPIQTGNPS